MELQGPATPLDPAPGAERQRPRGQPHERRGGRPGIHQRPHRPPPALRSFISFAPARPSAASRPAHVDRTGASANALTTQTGPGLDRPSPRRFIMDGACFRVNGPPDFRRIDRGKRVDLAYNRRGSRSWRPVSEGRITSATQGGERHGFRAEHAAAGVARRGRPVRAGRAGRRLAGARRTTRVLARGVAALRRSSASRGCRSRPSTGARGRTCPPRSRRWRGSATAARTTA